MIFSSTVSFVKSSHGVKYGSNLIQVPYRHIPQEKEKIIPMFSKYRIFLPLFILLSFRKMVSVVIFSLHSITVTVFAILLITSTSNGDDLKYKTCSSSFISCGNLTKVGYPFWGYDRPQYCGHPALQLRCIDNKDLVLEIGDDGEEPYYYLVKNISGYSEKSQMTIRLHEHFPTTCPFHSFNKAFNKIFHLREHQANVTLFYDCRQDMDGYSNCSVPCGEKKSTNYYLERKQHTETLCQSIEVPVPLNELQYLYSKAFDILEQGFEVDYRNSSASLKHPNLVTLYGCTSRNSRELLLVYEFVPNGTVADHLYGERKGSETLSWDIRMKIATETASALSYLHASEIIHRDVKTNNILLDSNFSVKVADFGLSRLFPCDATHVSTVPQGTPGYLDPQYHKNYQVTSKSDVYSFGVVLAELISSLPAVDISRQEDEINLYDYAMNKIQNGMLSELVDQSLSFESEFKVMRMITLVAELAFRCLQQDKELRPTMDEVLQALKQFRSTDYEALKAEDKSQSISLKAKNDIKPPDADTQHPPSPNSVIVSWNSRSTASNTSS